MSALFILVPVSIGLGLIGLCAFFWSLRHGQFEDPEGNARRVILEEESPPAWPGREAVGAGEDQPDRSRVCQP